MPYYPIFLELKRKPCLIVGGGEVAFRKTAALLRCGAKVTVASPELSVGLRQLARERKSWGSTIGIYKRLRWMSTAQKDS